MSWLGRWALLCGGLVALAGGAAWFASAPRRVVGEEQAAQLGKGDPEKGRILFAAGDCASCHASPGQPDRLRLGGGMALKSPFGTFRPPNISMHPTDGIGRWSAVEIANALLAGVSPDGRHYYPSFPYTSYARMELSDVGDLIAYLRTLAPVAGRAPPHDLVFPLTVRRALGLWKLLFLDRSPIVAEPAKPVAWNRGRYWVETVAHCAECHSPRNLAYAIEKSRKFAGGENPEGVGMAPNITSAALAHYTETSLLNLLTTGRTPDGRLAGAAMAEVVTNTAMLPEEDRKAIAAYILALPPQESYHP